MLYGGIPLILYFGHRKSNDFDFFSSLQLDSLIEDMILNNLKNSSILNKADNTLSIIYNNVKLSFFGDISFVNKVCPPY